MRHPSTRFPFLWRLVKEAPLDGVVVRLAPLAPHIRRRVLKGGYETAERALVREFVREGDRVLELGASVGVLTSLLARRVGPKGRVVAVEASPRLAAPFARQLERNEVTADRVAALACPLFGDTVPSELRELRFEDTEDSLSGGAAAQPSERPGGSGPVWRTAGAICAETALDPTVLIVDVEGTETIWSARAPAFPEGLRLILCEFHPRKTGAVAAGRAIQAVVDEGYRVAGQMGTVLAFTREGAAPAQPETPSR